MNQQPMQPQPLTPPSQLKYRSARVSLLTLILLSVINVFSIAFANIYFVFSAYFSQTFSWLGVAFVQETGENIYLIVFAVLAILAVVPYLLCWIFSKKRVGWLIAALVIFSIDTLFLLTDIPSYLAVGDFTIFLDLAMHIWALVSMAIGVKHGFAMKKEAEEAANAPAIDPFLNDVNEWDQQNNSDDQI